MCEVGSTPRIVSRGDGTPGKCCDVFECVNGTWGFSCSQRVYIRAGGGEGSVWPLLPSVRQGIFSGAQSNSLRKKVCLRSHSAAQAVRKGDPRSIHQQENFGGGRRDSM